MKTNRTLFSSLGFALVLASAQAVLIPANRLINWQAGVNVGVSGGIPTNRSTIIDVTASPYNADKTGASDASAAINSAIQAAGSGTIVRLPAGTYRIDSPINNTGKSNITIRGAGPTLTIIDSHVASGMSSVNIGADSLWPYDYSVGGFSITGGLTQGSTTLTVSDASSFSVGDIAIITENNDSSLPVIHVSGKGRERGQLSRVTGKSGSNLTISPGLYWTLGSSRAPKVHRMGVKITGVGVEDLKINLANSTTTFGILMDQTDGCWVKNTNITTLSNYGIYLLYAFQSEIRHCDIRDRKTGGSNGSAILMERSSGMLIEDNIICRVVPSLEVNFMSSGNVFAYNLCEDTSTGGVVGPAIDTNHGPHNSYNLYEGNSSPNIQCDGYFGSTSEDTIFRNWLHGTSPTASNRQPVLLQRFTRNYSLVGNILGKTGQTFPGIYVFGLPNMGNSSSTGTAQLSAGDAWADFGSSPGAGGFQELDLDVQATTVLKGNYNSVNGGIPAGEALGSDTLPNSLYRSSKPTWFGNLAWPAFDPLSPNQSIQAIPAGYRYINGTDPVAGPTVPPTNATISITSG